MFEQSLYQQEPVMEPQAAAQDGGLFHNYELKSWVPSPRLYKILGVSALANILALLVVAQTSLLTMKGCDSPLVGSVCTVLDTVYVGSMLFGTQREYADAAYERTQLSDMDVTFVELPSESSKLQYPEGYFQLANPEQFVADQSTITPGIPDTSGFGAFPNSPAYTMPRPVPGNNMLNTPPVYAKPKKDVVKGGELPAGLDAMIANANTANKKPKAGNNTPKDPVRNADGTALGTDGNTNANTNTTAQTPKTDEATQDQYGIYINKRPTKDFAAEALQKLEAKQIALDSPFRVTIKGTLGLANDGKTVVLKNPKQVPLPNANAGDPAMLKFAQEAVIAFADAGWFGYLDKLDSKTVTITLEQNDQTVIAKLTADQPDENKARSIASGLNVLIGTAAAAAAKNSDADAALFLSAAKPGSDGKTFFVNFELPKPVFMEMVQRKLAEEKAVPKQSNQPNGTAVVRPQNNLS